MKILILSGTGLLGSYLVKYFEDSDDIYWTTRGGKPKIPNEFHCELTYGQHVKHVMNEVKPDVILISAANPKTKFDNDEVSSIVNDNILSVSTIAQYAPLGCHIIYYSSVLVYGSSLNYINSPNEEDPCYPTSIYATTKLAAENILQNFKIQNRIKLTIFRLSQLVGPELRRGLLYDIINKVKGPKTTIELFGNSPGAYRPLTHLKDVAFCSYKAIEGGVEGIFNLSSQDSISVEDMAKMVFKEYGIKKSIDWNPGLTWLGDNPKVFVDTDKIEKVFGELHYNTAELAVRAAANVN